MSETTESLIRIESRTSKRLTTLKKGKIIFNDGHSVLECTIRNTSRTGAGLQLPCFMELPSIVTLAVEGGAKRVCEVVWSANDKVGVKYIDLSDQEAMESPRQLLLRRTKLLEDQLHQLRSEIETVLAP